MATQVKLIEGVKEIIQDSVFTSARILDYLNQAVRQIAGGMFIVYPNGTQIFSSPLPDLATNSNLTTSTTLPYISMPSDYGRNLFFLVSSTNEIEIILYDSYAEFMRAYPNLDATNRVIAAVVRGKLLYYQGYPSSAETLVAYYNRLPFDMDTITGATDISFAATTNRISDAGLGLGIFHAGQTIDVTGTTNNNDTLTVSSVAATGAYMDVDEDLTTEANTSAVIKSRPDGIPIHLHEALLENYAAWQIFQRKTKNDVPMDAEAKRYHGLFLGAMISMEASIDDLPGSIQITNG